MRAVTELRGPAVRTLARTGPRRASGFLTKGWPWTPTWPARSRWSPGQARASASPLPRPSLAKAHTSLQARGPPAASTASRASLGSGRLILLAASMRSSASRVDAIGVVPCQRRLRAHNVHSGTPSTASRPMGLAPLTADLRAFSSKLSVTDGDVEVKAGDDHPESIRRDRARLLDQGRHPLCAGHAAALRRVASHPMAHAKRPDESAWQDRVPGKDATGHIDLRRAAPART
jgi:hypothetical protein